MRTCTLLLLLSLCLVITPQGKAADSTEVASVIDTYVQRTGFSGTILVAKDGQAIYHRSYGLAYYATPDTIQNDYHYSIASVTKLFTSIRILQLVETGAIDLEASVVAYLPQFAALISDAVTVHHLLLHISGLPAEQDRVYRHPFAPATLVEQALRKNKPGQLGAFRYNNVDYMLLGLIIEERTGQSWERAITESILERLQLKHTGFLEYGHYPKKFAYSYREKGKRLQQDPLFFIENFYAAGQMYSTTGDLLRLDQALYTDQLLNAASKELLATSYPQYNYTGYGVWNYQYPFVDAQPTVMERRGGILGANVVLVRLTDQNYTLIILSNDDRFNPDSFGDEQNLREMLIRSLY